LTLDHDPLPIQSAAAFLAQTREVDAEALARLRADYLRRLRADDVRRRLVPDPDDSSR
jgi:hypothetical protein